MNTGTCNFWYDNWLDNGALFHRVEVHGTLTFKNFLVDGTWNSMLLAHYFPRDITALILQQPPPDGERAGRGGVDAIDIRTVLVIFRLPRG